MAVRQISWIVALLVFAGWIACALSSTAIQSANECQSVWRRTRDGWEHQDRLFRCQPLPPPVLHPTVVAALLILVPLCLLALAARNGKSVRTPAQSAHASATPWFKRRKRARSLCLPWKRGPFITW
jgi:hypothetical protein